MEPHNPKQPASPRRIILATADDGRFGHVASKRLDHLGWAPVLASCAEDVFRTLRQGDAAALLLDFSLPRADRILAKLKTDPDTNHLPVVVLFPRGTTPLRPRSVRVQGELELSEPCDVDKLLEALDRQASQAPAPGRSLRFLVPSCREGLDEAADLFDALLATCQLDEDERTSFLAACREAVANAIEHGNKADPKKVVHVACHAEPSALTVEVRDGGDGFDPTTYLELARKSAPADAARDRNRQGGRGGLGIVMMFRFTDELRYNDRGNVLTLVKNLKGARQ